MVQTIETSSIPERAQKKMQLMMQVRFQVKENQTDSSYFEKLARNKI